MLSSLQNRVDSLKYGNNACNKKTVSILHQRQVKACIKVRKYLDGQTFSPMKDYFGTNKHSLGTRNQNHLLKLPRIRLEI